MQKTVYIIPPWQGFCIVHNNLDCLLSLFAAVIKWYYKVSFFFFWFSLNINTIKENERDYDICRWVDWWTTDGQLCSFHFSIPGFSVQMHQGALSLSLSFFHPLIWQQRAPHLKGQRASVQNVTESDQCVCVCLHVCCSDMQDWYLIQGQQDLCHSSLPGLGAGGGKVGTGIMFLLVTRANMVSLPELISICNLSPSQMMSAQVSLQKRACVCLLSASCRMASHWCPAIKHNSASDRCKCCHRLQERKKRSILIFSLH